jgi:glyoxylase-like metal-dependent hydrolase (beta-lactamase superfamily II)
VCTGYACRYRMRSIASICGRRLQDTEEITIGKHRWRVIVGSGHSPEHACFYCPNLKLFISGDQVLPRISSNVSVYPVEPDANPMADWYASMAKLKDKVPDDVLGAAVAQRLLLWSACTTRPSSTQPGPQFGTIAARAW